MTGRRGRETINPNDVAHGLVARILDRTAVITVIGAGYVGLPLAVEKAKVGFRVVAIDHNPVRIEKVNRGESYILDVPPVDLAQVVAKGALRATSKFDDLAEADIIIICVPTPLTANREPDLSYIRNTSREIAQRLRRGHLICLESTTYPGTTQEVILPILAQSNLKVGQDFFLAFSPERVDPGNARYTTRNINKLVGGVTRSCLQVAKVFYSQTIQTVIAVSSPEVAEMAKIFENTYRAVNIALVNEMALLCDRMNLNVWEVLDAAFTKPFGIMPFYPGPGVGGHCVPIDPFYLAWKAREYDFSTRFVELAGEINLRMPYFVIEKAGRALGEQGRALRGSRILLVGVTYKRDLPDVRESPALKIINLLQKEGAIVEYHDPFINEVRPNPNSPASLTSVPLDVAHVQSADIVIIATDHSQMDYQWVTDHARMVLDTRNATRDVHRNRERVRLL